MKDKIFIPRYSHMKEKYKNWAREDMYMSYLISADISMFEYSGLPGDLDPRFIEMWLHLYGSVGFCKDGDRYVCGFMPARTGGLNMYGDGTEMILTTCNGQSYNKTIDKDGVIMYNAPSRMPDLDIMIDTEMFAAIDKSLSINTRLSRVAPVLFGQNSVQTNRLTDCLKAICEGELFTVQASNQNDLFPATDILEKVEPTSPERAQYLQYLSEYWDDVQRRHFSRRGLAAKTSTKHAQVSTDEVHGLDCISWFYPLACLNERRKALEKFNEIFGESVSVQFSEVWEQEYQGYIDRLEVLDNEADGESEGGRADGQDHGDHDVNSSDTVQSEDN